MLLLLTGSAPARSEDIFEGVGRMFEDWGLFQGIEVSGSNSFTLQDHALEGSKSAFEGQRWDTETLVRTSSLHVEGPIWRNLGLQMDISSTGWGDSYTRYVLGWTAEETALYYGDLNIRLGGNEFATFNKTLQGWQIDQQIPNGLVRGFYSREKGRTRRETIEGNNTSGPFFLRYTPIIEGSEVVKVDEEVLEFGQDYRLDYETGQLWFEPVDAPPRIIPGTSTISVSYQSFGYESTPGILYGARAEMHLLDDKMVLGVTGVEQDKRDPDSAGDTAGYQEDIYQGSGTTGPFDTNFRPILPNGATVVYEGERQTIDQTVVVLVDNVEQVQGVDYDVYHDVGRIIFRRAVPPTALVKIQYYYDLGEQDTMSGDSRVLGLDLGYRIADGLSLRADWARSNRADGSGQAWRSSVAYSRPDLNATLELRDVQPGFSYVDTVGFQRKEKGLNFATQWQVNDHISIYDRFSDLESDSGLTFGSFGGTLGGGSFGTYGMQSAQTPTSSLGVKTQRNDVGIDVNYPGWPTLSLTRQTLENSGGTNTDREQTTDMVSLNYAPYELPLTLNFNLSSTQLDYSGDASSLNVTNSSTDRMQLSATYTPSSTLSLAGHYGVNSSSSEGSDDDSDGSVTQLSARWTPSSTLSLSIDHTRSESTGSTRISTFQIDNPGGGGGVDDGDDDTGDQTRRLEDANTRVDLSWRPANNLNLTLAGGFRDYTSGGGIGYLADSEQTYYNASLGWQPNDELSLTTTWGRDEQVFLEEGAGAVKNDMLSLGVNYRPANQPWDLSLNLHKQTGSSPTTISSGSERITRTVPTDLLDISGELSYEIREGISLFGRLGRADFDSGYAAFVKDTGELGLRYRASELADVSFGYRYIKNISGDPALPLPGSGGGSLASQDYIAHTFLLEVSSNFASGLGSAGRSTGGFSGYSGALSSFGGYGAGLNSGSGYGYESGGIGDFSGQSTYNRGRFSGGTTTGSFGRSGGFTNRSTDFFAGAENTRGSSARYRSSGTGRSGFETGISDFDEQEETTVERETAAEPTAPFDTGGERQKQTRARKGPPGQPGPGFEQPEEPGGRCLREGVERWWQWYE